MVSTTSRKSRIGDNSGSVMYLNACQRLAPSRDALSYNSSGIACMPTRVMMKLNPMPSQAVVTASAGSAVEGEDAQVVAFADEDYGVDDFIGDVQAQPDGLKEGPVGEDNENDQRGREVEQGPAKIA